MKRRKSLSRSTRAIARGEQIAVEAGKSLSKVVEDQLLTIPSPEALHEDYWPGPALKPVRRPGDARYQFLKRKHR